MKLTSRSVLRPSFWVCAASLGVLSIGLVDTSFAQPGTGKKNRMDRGRAKRIPKKMTEALETKLGKPLTPEQKEQILTAMQARDEATKAARDKFTADLVKATGLTTEDAEAIATPQRGNRAKADKPAAANP